MPTGIKLTVVFAAAVCLIGCGKNNTSSDQAQPRETAQPRINNETSLSPNEVVVPELPAGFQPEQIMGLNTPLLALGPEPFWTAEIGEGWIVFDRPGLPLVEVPVPEFEPSAETISLSSQGLDMTLRANGCDGAENPIGVEIIFDDSEFTDQEEDFIYVGCAGSADGFNAGTPSTDWSYLIEPSSGAISACMEMIGPEHIILALYPREPGIIGMVLGDKLGGFFECGADLETGQALFLDPMSPFDAGGFMTGAAYLPDRSTFACAEGERLGEGVYLADGCTG